MDELLQTNGYGTVLGYKLVGAEIRKPSETKANEKAQSHEDVDGVENASASEEQPAKTKRYKVRPDTIFVPSSLVSSTDSSTDTTSSSFETPSESSLARIFSPAWDQTLEGQTFYHLLLLKSFVPSPALYMHVHTKHFVHSSSSSAANRNGNENSEEGGIPPEMQLTRARNVARTRVYNLRYLSKARCWGPFLPVSRPPEERPGPRRRGDGRGRRGAGASGLLMPNIIAQALNIAPQHLDFVLAHLLRRLDDGFDDDEDEEVDEEEDEGNGEDGESAETGAADEDLEAHSSSKPSPLPAAWDIDTDDDMDTNSQGAGTAAEPANSNPEPETGATTTSGTETDDTTTTLTAVEVAVDFADDVAEEPSPFLSVELTISEEDDGDGGGTDEAGETVTEYTSTATATATGTATAPPANDDATDDVDADADDDEEDGASTPHTHSHPITFSLTRNLHFAPDAEDEDEDDDSDSDYDPSDEHPTYVFPTSPHLLYPDYAFLAGVRIVLEGNLRGRMEDIGEEWEGNGVPLLSSLAAGVGGGGGGAEGEHEEDENPKFLLQRLLNSLHSLEVTRMGSAPNFWGNGWRKDDFELNEDDGEIVRDENGVPLLKRDDIRDSASLKTGGNRASASASGGGKARRGGAREPKDGKRDWDEFDGGWDWAGVEGLWMRLVCWMDYRTLQCAFSFCFLFLFQSFFLFFFLVLFYFVLLILLFFFNLSFSSCCTTSIYILSLVTTAGIMLILLFFL
jgi:hypothetical protein